MVITKVMKPYQVFMHYVFLMKLNTCLSTLFQEISLKPCYSIWPPTKVFLKRLLKKNKLEPHVIEYIEQFNDIDEVSRITNMPRKKDLR